MNLKLNIYTERKSCSKLIFEKLTLEKDVK